MARAPHPVVQSFRFLDLPTAIRSRVYRELLYFPLSRVQIHCPVLGLRHIKTQLGFNMKTNEPNRYWQLFCPKEATMAILYSSSITRNEAMACFLTYNDFEFANLGDLEGFLWVIGGRRIHLLQKITMNLTNWSYPAASWYSPLPKNAYINKLVGLKQISLLKYPGCGWYQTENMNIHSQSSAPEHPIMNLLKLPDFEYSHWLPEGDAKFKWDIWPKFHEYVYVKQFANTATVSNRALQSDIQPFRFLDLPPELRLQIYREILGFPEKTVQIYCQRSEQSQFERRHKWNSRLDEPQRFWRLSSFRDTRMSILHTSSLIRDEAKAYFCSITDFEITSLQGLLAFLEFLGDDYLPSVRRLTLNMRYWHASREKKRLTARLKSKLLYVRQITLLRHVSQKTVDDIVKRYKHPIGRGDPISRRLKLKGFTFVSHCEENNKENKGKQIYKGPKYYRFTFVKK
jgi:2EXR family